jgi:hypothetical protein
MFSILAVELLPVLVIALRLVAQCHIMLHMFTVGHLVCVELTVFAGVDSCVQVQVTTCCVHNQLAH